MSIKTSATSSDKFCGFFRDVRRVLLADFTPRQPCLRIANLDKLTGDNKELIVSQLKTVFEIFTSSEEPLKTRRQTAALTSQIFDSLDDTLPEPNTPHIVVDVTGEEGPTTGNTTVLNLDDLCRLIKSFRSDIDPTAVIPATVRHFVDCIAIPDNLVNLGPNFDSPLLDTMNTPVTSTSALTTGPNPSVTVAGNISATLPSDQPISLDPSSQILVSSQSHTPIMTTTPSYTQQQISHPHSHAPVTHIVTGPPQPFYSLPTFNGQGNIIDFFDQFESTLNYLGSPNNARITHLQRNLSGTAAEYLRYLIRTNTSEWPWANFVQALKNKFSCS